MKSLVCVYDGTELVYAFNELDERSAKETLKESGFQLNGNGVYTDAEGYIAIIY